MNVNIRTVVDIMQLKLVWYLLNNINLKNLMKSGQTLSCSVALILNTIFLKLAQIFRSITQLKILNTIWIRLNSN